MFHLLVSEYIKTNMIKHQMTYKDLEAKSGVPLSSLHSYAHAKVTKPTEDNLVRIAAAFGDLPCVISDMHKASEEALSKEKAILDGSKDAERMEQFAALVRSNVSQILEEYRVQAIAQQRETSLHADGRVEEAERKAAERIEEIERKCAVRIEEAERRCAENIEAIRDRFSERERMYKEHCDELRSAEHQIFEEVRANSVASSDYLRTLVRNLTISLISVSILAIALGMYAVFAYHTFDVNDLTQGLAQHEHTAFPFVALLVAVCLVVFLIGKFVFAKKALGERQK